MDSLVAVSAVSRARELHDLNVYTSCGVTRSTTPPRAGRERLPPTDVPCPMCRHLPLYEFRRVLACRCGFFLDTAGGFGIHHLRDRLGELLARHKELCGREPVLEVCTLGGARNLMATCPVCHDVSVVL